MTPAQEHAHTLTAQLILAANSLGINIEKEGFTLMKELRSCSN